MKGEIYPILDIFKDDLRELRAIFAISSNESLKHIHKLINAISTVKGLNKLDIEFT